jgi:hypothetical protein
MSLHASDAIHLELPRRLWADRASDVLGILAVGAVGWVSARNGPAASSVGMALLTAVLLRLAPVRDPVGRSIRVVPGGRTRRLGPSLVVEGSVRPSGQALGSAWLTPRDVPTDAIRRLTVRLWAQGPKAGS